MNEPSNRYERVAGVVLALMPIGSFLLQYVLSAQAGTEVFLFQHLTITFVDWIFVPFNFFVVRVIDWHRGGVIFAVTILSVVLNSAAHAFWQYHFSEGGHMISKEQVMLPAGWVHLIYSTLQMILLAAFIFARRPSSSHMRITTLIAVCYFIAAGFCGYVMNNGFMITDVMMVSLGLFFVVGYPAIVRRTASSAE